MSGRKSTKKLLWFEVLNDFEKKHGNRYDYKYLEEDYKNSTTKVRIICKEHGVFKQLPSEHKNGGGCPFCSKTKKLTQDEVILRFIKKHNDRYDYSLVEYTTWSNNVKIICSEHGIFEQSPSNHTKGAGCPTCAKILKSKKLRKPIKNILEDFNEVHFDKYNRPEVKVRFIEDSYEFYLNWTFKLERIHNIKKIEMTIGEKIALIQLSKYNSALAHIKSRWFNDDRKILETLWKKYNKSKHRANKVLEDFIKSKEERGWNSDCQYNAYYCHIWIAEFTKQKTITQKSILGLK